MDPFDDVPANLGRYYLDGIIGRGGMGTVYRARIEDSSQEVALKVLLPELARDLEYLKRFKREITAGARLKCPYVVRILDWGEDKGHFFFSMELLEDARELAELLEDREELPAHEVIEIGIQLCDALAELHSTGVVHRDIKPGNVMTLKDGSIKLMDFGLAKMLDRTSLTATGEALGSPRYMSPEILHGKPADYRSDIYQVGLLMYECLCGEPAFDGDSFDRLLHLILETKAKNIQRLCPGLSKDFSAVIELCMKKNPKERYRSVGDLKSDLEAIKNGRAPSLKVSSSTKQRGLSSGSKPRVSSSSSTQIPAKEEDRFPRLFSRPFTFKLYLLLFSLLLCLVLFLLFHSTSTPIDPQIRVKKGFDSVAIHWRSRLACATRARIRLGDGPIKEYTNASEQKSKEHRLSIENLRSGRLYKVKLVGLEGPYRKTLSLRLPGKAPLEEVKVNRLNSTLSVSARAAVEVSARLEAVSRERVYLSEQNSGQEDELIDVSLEGLSAHRALDSLELILTDSFGDRRRYPLERPPGTAEMLMMSLDSRGVPLEAALEVFKPGARSFFEDSLLPFETKRAVYHALLAADVDSRHFRPFVEWEQGKEKIFEGESLVRVRGKTFPQVLDASSPSDSLLGKGELFVIHLDRVIKDEENVLLCYERGDLLAGESLKIRVGAGFMLEDDAGRGSGVWRVAFPADAMEGRPLLMIRFVLLAEAGRELELKDLGILLP